MKQFKKLKIVITAAVLICCFTISVEKTMSPVMTTEQKNDLVLLSWIDKVIEKESSHRNDLVILDVNNRYSYGCLQFQKATFDGYSKKFGFNGEIMNCDDQKKLALLMLKDSKSAWRNWYNTVTKKGVGLPPNA